MGCQGEICVVYGLKVDAKVEWMSGRDDNPVIYSINGYTLCEDLYVLEEYRDIESPTSSYKLPKKIDYYNGISVGYGAADMQKATLIMRVLGHSNWLGARHFKGQALVGYVVGNECYIDSATELPTGDQICAEAPRLVRDFKEKLDLDVDASQFRTYLLFDALNQ